jgi:hypothetical protein
VSGLLNALSGFTAWIVALYETIKWFLLFVLGLVALVLIARVISIGQAMVLAIAAVIRFLVPRKPSPAVVVEETPAVRVRCPGCKKGARIPPAYVGKPLRCKRCDKRFRVPA